MSAANYTNLRWLLVGTGDIAQKRVAPALASVPGSSLAAVYSRDLQRAQSFGEQFGAREAFNDFGKALRETSADAVYLATPVSLHVEQAIAAMQAGKHVLVEKPLGLNAEDAARAVAAAQQCKRVCACAYYRRCQPRYAHARRMIETGALGEVVMARMVYHSWYNPAPDDPKHWRVLKGTSGGGPLSDIACHMLDVLVGLLGMPRTVIGKVSTLVHGYDVEDSASVMMEMPQGAQVTGSFLWNTKVWAHEFEIVGTEAKLRWAPYDSGKVAVTTGRTLEEVELPPATNVHAPLIEDFVAAVRDRRPPAAPLSEAVKTNQLIDAIYQSAAGNQEVRL